MLMYMDSRMTVELSHNKLAPRYEYLVILTGVNTKTQRHPL